MPSQKQMLKKSTRTEFLAYVKNSKLRFNVPTQHGEQQQNEKNE